MVELSYALARKYPNADREWMCQYVFPSEKHSIDPRSKVVRRHHLDESGLQKAVRRAALDSGIAKHVTPDIFRHCFATHLLEAGYDTRTVLKYTTSYPALRALTSGLPLDFS